MAIAEKLVKVAEDMPKVYEAGRKSEYDRFWDIIQKNGIKCNYNYAFCGSIWVDDIYNPKYDIVCTGAVNMFRQAEITDSKVTVDIRGANGTYMFFDCPKLRKIRKIIVNENNLFTGCFQNNVNLEEIRFEGTIGNSLDLHWSTKLSMESLANILSCLSKTSTGQTITLPTTAKATYDAVTYPGRWDEAIAEYPNWTFAYA